MACKAEEFLHHPLCVHCLLLYGLQDVVRFGVLEFLLQKHVGESEYYGKRVIDLVGHARSKCPHRRQLLGIKHLLFVFSPLGYIPPYSKDLIHISPFVDEPAQAYIKPCLLYTSDAADEEDS